MSKINFCYHATVQAIWFLIVWQIDSSLSRTCLNIAQWRLESDCASTSLFGQSVAPSFFRTILQFFNFRIIFHWSLQTLFVFFCFLFFLLLLLLLLFFVHGTAIGTKFAPPYAILFMADLEEKILNAFEEKPMIWWRYIDDIFLFGNMEKNLWKNFSIN